MKKLTEENKEKKEWEINFKICLQLLFVVFSMCGMIFLMFFSVYTEKELPKNENSDQNKEAFEETGFYKIISYEMSKSTGECAIFGEKSIQSDYDI